MSLEKLEKRIADLESKEVKFYQVTTLGDVTLDNVNFIMCDFRGLRDNENVIISSNFVLCSFNDAHIAGTWFGGVIMRGCEIRNTKATDIDFSDCQVYNSTLSTSDLTCSLLRGSIFKNCDLDRVELRAATVKDCKFLDCDLERTNFTGAELKNCVFTHADLSHCDFSRAELVDVNFQNCDLSYVKGNGKEIVSFEIEDYHVVLTKEEVYLDRAATYISVAKTLMPKTLAKLGVLSEEELEFWKKHRKNILKQWDQHFGGK